MKNIITIMFTIAIFLFLGACSTQSPEPTTKGIRETPPDVSLIIDGERYSTLLASYCWEKAHEKTNEATIECVDKAPPEVLLADETPIHVATNTDGVLDIDYPTPPTDIDVTAFLADKEVKVERSDQTISLPHKQGSYFYIAWLTWEEDEEVVSEASYVFAVEVE